MVFREGTEFTVKEIAEASGRSEANIARRIIDRRRIGAISGRRVKHLKGGPSVYTYDEVKAILRPLGDDVPDALRMDADANPQRIAALRPPGVPDGFTIRA